MKYAAGCVHHCLYSVILFHFSLRLLLCWACMQAGSGNYRPPLLRLITLLLVVYVYDIDLDTFKQLPDMPPSLPVQLWNAKQALQSIEEGESRFCTPAVTLKPPVMVYPCMKAFHKARLPRGGVDGDLTTSSAATVRDIYTVTCK